MPLLGYDFEGVAALRRAMRDAADELAALRNDDPGATGAMAVARSCRTALCDVWLPVVDAVLACSANEPAATALTPADLRLVETLGREHRGWRLVADPAGGSSSLVLAAHDVGAQLAAGRSPAEMSTAELTTLAINLTAIASDPAAAAALRDVLDGTGWIAPFDALGLDRLDQAGRAAADSGDRDAADRVGAIDAAIGSLAAVLASAPRRERFPWTPSVVDQLDPYSAALVLSHLDLDPRVTAAAAEATLSRWMDGHDGERLWVDPFTPGDNAADLLFRWLADQPEAARWFVLRAAGQPELLFRTAHDDASVVAVLTAGTDPAVMPVADAGRAVRPLVDWATGRESTLGPASDGGVDDVRAVLAATLAPWLLQLTARSEDWSWNPDDADRALRWVIEDEQAVSRLLDTMSGWQRSMAGTRLVGPDGRIDGAALDELGTLFANLQLALHDQQVSDAASAAFWTDAALFVGQIAASAFVPGGPVASMAADVALEVVAPAAATWLRGQGLLPADGADAARVRFGSRSADTAVVAVVAVAGQLIEHGLLPPGSLDDLRLDEDGSGCTPEVVDEQLRRWVHGLAPNTDPACYNALVATLNAFSNPLSNAQQC